MSTWLKPTSRSLMLWLALGAGLVVQPAAPARADEEQDRGSTYARVRYVEGGLTLQSTGQGEVVDAVANTPIVPGDSAWTQDGRAEIELADGSVLRLDAGTRLDVRNLSDLENRYESTNLIALEQGSLRIDTPEPSSSDKVFQIDTEGGSVYLLSGGSFRIDAEGNVCTVSSLRGVAELSGDAGSVLVRSGERSSAGGGRNPSEPRPFNTLRQDDFDRFCQERDGVYLRQADQGSGDTDDRVRRQAPPEVDPYVNELSTYGDWREVPDYGYVWRPRYTGAWGPYVNGHWVWSPSGWVWVSYDPWGWAPYHYGRWDFMADIGWFWIPGEIWSGAWVSFAVGPTYVGWCPLNYYNRPVFTSVVNVTNVNVGRLDPRGWRFIPAGRFGARGDRFVVRPDRLPRGTEVSLTGRLPRFDARDVTARPQQWSRVVDEARAHRATFPADASQRGVPFRTQERRGDQSRPAAHTAPQQRLAPPVRGGHPRGDVSRPRSSAPRPRPQSASPSQRSGVAYGGPQMNRWQVPPRERPQRSDQTYAQPSTPGASRTPDRGRSMEPRRRDDLRPTPFSPQQPGSPGSIAETPRPRGHFVERLFDNVRRDRAVDRTAPPSRVEAPPPQAQPRQEARPPRQESHPRPTPARPERPPRGGGHRR